MHTKWQLLRRSCLWVGLIECLLAVVPVAAAYNSDVAYNLWPVILLAGLVNFPGLVLSFGLNFMSWAGPDPGPHPLAAWILIFAVGSVFWVIVVWFILRKRNRGPVDGS